MINVIKRPEDKTIKVTIFSHQKTSETDMPSSHNPYFFLRIKSPRIICTASFCERDCSKEVIRSQKQLWMTYSIDQTLYLTNISTSPYCISCQSINEYIRWRKTRLNFGTNRKLTHVCTYFSYVINDVTLLTVK